MLEWARNKDSNVLLFDPTHGTNNMHLKLCCFVTISRHGATVILAFVLIDTESTEAVEWAFRSFAEVFKLAPSVLLTDSGASIASAFNNVQQSGVWTSVEHLLCVFHLSKNFFEHCSPLVKDRAKFHELTNKFWHVAKESDSSSVEHWDADWEELVELFKTSSDSKESKRYADTVKWLKDLGEVAKARKYAYRFTCRLVLFLMHSTVRSEAINSAVKKCVSNSNMLVTDLVSGLIRYNEESRADREVSALRQAIRQHAVCSTSPPYIECFRSRVTPYAFELIRSQFTMSTKYLVKETWETVNNDEAQSDIEGTYFVSPFDPATVKKRTVNVNDDGVSNDCNDLDDAGLTDHHYQRTASLAKCSCQFDQSSGLDLCRHRIAIMTMLWQKLPDEQQFSFLGADMSSKWLVQEEDTELEALRTVRCMPAPSVPRPHVSNVASNSKEDRYSLLMAEMRILADTASNSQAMTNELLSRVSGMLSEMALNKFIKTAEEAPARNVQEEARLAAEKANRERNADADSLKAALGLTLQTDKRPTASAWFDFYQQDEAAFLLGKHIAYKYNDIGKGGWYVGKITHMIGPTTAEEVGIYNQDGTLSKDAKKNFTVLFSDGALGVALYAFNRTLTPYYLSKSTTWVLLDSKAMDDTPDLPEEANVVPAAHAATKGRNQSKRLTPANRTAPTGAAAKRQHGRGDRG